MFLRSCACGSEEHTSELQHLGISYAVFCLKKKIEKRRDALAHAHRLLPDRVSARQPGRTSPRSARSRWRVPCPSLLPICCATLLFLLLSAPPRPPTLSPPPALFA